MEELAEIKELYAQVERKTDFVNRLAEVTGRRYNTIRNHWFGSGWQIPTDMLGAVLGELRKEVA